MRRSICEQIGNWAGGPAPLVVTRRLTRPCLNAGGLGAGSWSAACPAPCVARYADHRMIAGLLLVRRSAAGRRHLEKQAHRRRSGPAWPEKQHRAFAFLIGLGVAHRHGGGALAASSRQSLDHVPSIVEQHQGRGVRRLGLGARIDHRDEAIKRKKMAAGPAFFRACARRCLLRSGRARARVSDL